MKKRDSSYWTEHIEGWRASGKTKKEYCTSQKLNIHTFDYWQGKLKSVSSSGKFVKVSERIDSACLELPNGYKLHIEEGTSAEFLTTLINLACSA